MDTSLIITKIFIYFACSFLLAMWAGPIFIEVLVWLKFWKKKAPSVAVTGEKLSVTKSFYSQDESKMHVPRAGGILIWSISIAFALFFWFFLKIEEDNQVFLFLNFVSRQQTFIPIAILFFGSIFGLIDDTLSILESGGNYKAGGLKLSYRLILVFLLSFASGVWFYARLGIKEFSIFAYKLNLDTFRIPIDSINSSIHNNSYSLAFLTIIITALVMLGTWSSSVIDGFDGLAMSVMIPLYICFGILTFAEGYYNISTLLFVMLGTMLAFAWYNLPPAKFYLGETGAMGMFLVIATVSILIDKIYVLPISGIALVITSGSNIIQFFSKKILKKKAIPAAPFHHSLVYWGLTKNQVVLIYLLVSIVACSIGTYLGLVY